MKTIVAVLLTFVITLTLGWFIWGQHHATAATDGPASVANAKPAIATPRPVPLHPSNLPLPGEWQELRTVRATTLQNNPELSAEYTTLMIQMDQQQHELDAATLKADAKVAPVLAKLDELRKTRTANSPGAQSTSAPGATPTLSPQEWQEFRTARFAAEKADPTLVTKASQLSQKMRQFQQKLNAAMLAADPQLAVVMAKFSPERQTYHPPLATTPQH